MTTMQPQILVATWSDGLFSITGPGQRTHEFSGQTVTGPAPDGHGGALAIIGGHSLRRRAPSGEWRTITTCDDFDLSCCMATGEAIYAGTDNARLLRLNPETRSFEVIDSFDRVEGRDTWFAGSAIVNGQRVGPPLGIRSIAANSTGSVLFANVHVGGIPRSVDSGTTWHPTIDINCDVHEVRAHPTNPNLVAAASAAGLCISHDAGATWSIDQNGLHAIHCSAVAFSGDDIILSSSTSQFAIDGRLYRRSAQPDGVLKPIKDGISEWIAGIVDTGCVATNGSRLAFADSTGNLYVLEDFGQKWARWATGLDVPSGVLIL
jgi:hypothetical protein